MSSTPPPPPATENDDMVDTVEAEVPPPVHAVESAAGTSVDDAAPPAGTGSSSDHQEAHGGDEGEDLDDVVQNIAAAVVAHIDYMDMVDAVASYTDYRGNDVAAVDHGIEEEEEGGGKLSESAEVEATVEALWRKVVAVEDKPSAGHPCSVCMEHLTCEGAHRICCIPCGHVYGRSCLERWLQRNGNETAKCPQCGVVFEDNKIIDLHAPGNLSGGCGNLQEVKVYVTKAIAEVVAQCERRMEATLASASSKIAKMEAEQLSYDRKVGEKLTELRALMVQVENERRLNMEIMDAAVDRMRAEVKSVEERISDICPAPPCSDAPPSVLD